MNISSPINIAAPTISDIARVASGQESAQARANPIPPVDPTNENANILNRENPNQNPNQTSQAANGEAVEERGAGNGQNANANGESADNSEGQSGESREQGQSQNPEQTSPSGQQLTEQELEQIKILAARDAEVRTHEQAHANAGGSLAGAPSYTYERGPNGQRYAVGGEVSIDVSPVAGDPEATIRKMEKVRRAALAPAEPSPQDRSVAATASQQAAQARSELTALRAAQSNQAGAGGNNSDSESQSSNGFGSAQANPSAVAERNRERISQAQPQAITVGNLLQAQA